jgi:hypothetical protein
MKEREPYVAFFLGLISFVLLMFIGEKLQYSRGDAGVIEAFIYIGAFLFICQFFLSRGNRDAYRRDWLMMLALNAPFLLVLGVTVFTEKPSLILAYSLGILFFCCGGTFAGAVAASLWARRKRGQR